MRFLAAVRRIVGKRAPRYRVRPCAPERFAIDEFVDGEWRWLEHQDTHTTFPTRKSAEAVILEILADRKQAQTENAALAKFQAENRPYEFPAKGEWA